MKVKLILTVSKKNYYYFAKFAAPMRKKYTQKRNDRTESTLCRANICSSFTHFRSQKFMLLSYSYTPFDL